MTSVSIIVPVYNVGKYIERCLLSIEKQDYEGEMECILVDDCGCDDSMAIAILFVEKHRFSRIKYIIQHHAQNLGLSEARNTGIKHSSGDYIFFLDSDDELPCNAISLLVNEVNSHPNIDIVIGNMHTVNNNNCSDFEKHKPSQYIENNNWLNYQFLKEGNSFPVQACNKLTKSSFIKDNNLYFLPGIIHEDNLWTFQTLKHIKTCSFVYETTYLRYINEGSITTSSDDSSIKTSWQTILYKISQNITSPLKSLKLGRFCYLYCVWELYSNNPYGKQTIRNFGKASFKCRHYKLFLLLMLWNLFPSIQKKYLFIRIQRNAYKIYHSETIKNRAYDLM